MEHDYTFKISGAAKADIESINNYISKTLCNPAAARDLNNAFREAIRQTCSNPYMWPQVKSTLIKDASLRKLPVKSYLIFYRPDDRLREIQIIRVLYGMRNYEDIL
ncbi:MAG: type II toxin-antitoxin system RelE/ParE family toxin [Oscillospiraceae bacterium]|nr:type II toxin-antitoxin system RelE/ParE family toxin [Oscillospiraceae bacterium]